VMHLARVAPGVVVRAGTKVLPGKFVRTQAEADSESLGKIARLVDADRVFMAGVLHVNTSLARHYAELQQLTPSLVRGAGRDPGESDFNPAADLPTFAGHARALPDLRNRIIGHVTLADAPERLDSVMGRAVSIRADEGETFVLGHLAKVQDRVTFHALEHTGIDVGDGDWFGFHTVVHGGSDSHNSPVERTRLGGAVVVKDWAVVFRSTIGDGSVIGVRAYVDGTNLPPKSVVPDRAIIIGGKQVGVVEW
jgi:carbonic anhydrase/acetyltransferase-like protein (isoleucine patch superfamily)